MPSAYHEKSFLFLLNAFATIISYSSSLSIMTIQNKETFLNPETERGWGEWSEWNSCSRSCGGGVTYMRRECLIRLNGSDGCVGPDKMYSSCNIQDCPDDSVDFRSEQCASHNNRVFGGRTFEWKPYVGEAVLNSCELHCKAENSSFVNKLSDKVADGTRCKPNSNDICVDGTCQKVGCDMMLGSDLREDKCLECGGDGSSCFRVNGVFRATNLPSGYVDVVTIPAGATNIEIIVNRTPQNFLAVRDPSNRYFLNGNRRSESSGTHQVAGTTFYYLRKLDRRKASESLRARGPTMEESIIQMFVQETNRGIRYRFYLPRKANNPNEVDLEWIPSDWSKCSRVCGGGVQHRRISCMKHNETVQSYLCHSIRKPVRRQRCNVERCVARWHTSNWTECSASCNGGVKFRQVFCTESSTISQSSLRLVNEKRCKKEDSDTRPRHKERCNEFPCSEWHLGNWSSCSTSCGSGHQFRSVTCPPGMRCTPDAPERLRRCNSGPCTRTSWVVTDWSRCTEFCGGGMQSRLVRCTSEHGGIYDDILCQGLPRPVANQSCQDASECRATPQWMTGEWSECSAECGAGLQTRKVLCSILEEGRYRILPDENCNGQTAKPETMRNCLMPDCKATWFKGPWNECSQTCAEGTRNRLVMCLSDLNRTQREPACDDSNRPEHEETCNHQQCPNSENLNPTSTAAVLVPAASAECDLSLYGCCPDRVTPARGWLLEGCPGVDLDETLAKSCHMTTYGCCHDGVQPAQGSDYRGCPEYDFCFVPVDQGTFCGEWFPRYFFDPNDSQCKHFWYGGCTGNENNYENKEKCLAKCGKPNKIPDLTSTSFTNDVTTTTSLRTDDTSQATTSVEHNTIGSSSPNLLSTEHPSTTADNTATLASHKTRFTDEQSIIPRVLVLPAIAENASTLWIGPKARVLSVEDCSLPPDQGPCFRRLHRWYFDALDHSCKTFIFSGCAANANNFETRDECVTACYKEEHVNVEHDRELTKCELDQSLADFEEKRPPQCDPRSGKYRPLQCMSDINGVTLSCWCVDSESGVEVDGSRRYGSIAPDCSSPSQPKPSTQSSLCLRSRYGCCPDGITPALGLGKRGCSVSLRIKAGRSIIYTRPGSSASLPCPAVGYPKPRVKWFKDGEELSITELISGVVQNEYDLIFTSVQPRHLGSYVCEASNGVNLKQRKTVRLAITEERLRFRSKPSNLTMKVGSNGHLRCRVRGDRASITWLKDGKPLISSNHATIKPWGDLRIDKIVLSDQGVYTCVAESTSERISVFSILSVFASKSNVYVRPSLRSITASQSTKASPCQDNPDLADCRLVAAAGMCAKEQYRNLCCSTCRHVDTDNDSDSKTERLS